MGKIALVFTKISATLYWLSLFPIHKAHLFFGLGFFLSFFSLPSFYFIFTGTYNDIQQFSETEQPLDHCASINTG